MKRILPPHKSERGQLAQTAVMMILLLILVATVLLDVSHLLEARNWAYRLAQDAALAGVSQGRVWDADLQTTGGGIPSGCITPPPMELDAVRARNVAQMQVEDALTARGLSGYTLTIEVLPDAGGGHVSNFPPDTTRLGIGSNWQTDAPAVGVALEIPVTTFLLSFIGREHVDIAVFAAAEVIQPEELCP